MRIFAFASSATGSRGTGSSREALTLFLCLLLVTVGCGPGNPLGRLSLSGSVTFNGQSLESGMIQFTPEDSEGVGSGASIKNGTYTIDKQQGLPPGRYRVMIFSPLDSTPISSDEPAGGTYLPPSTERIPVEYNFNSTLTAEVTDEGPNEFNFILKGG